MKGQLILCAALGCAAAVVLTWLLGLNVHIQPFVQSVEAPASFLVAGAGGALVGAALRFAIRESFGI